MGGLFVCAGLFVRSGLLVQISDRFALGAQRTNVLPRNDLTGHAVNLVPLCRRPAAKILHAFEQAEPEDLRIFAYAYEIDRVLARRNGVAGRKFEILPALLVNSAVPRMTR